MQEQDKPSVPFGRKWCPWGRISFQRVTMGGVEVVPGLSFNRALDATSEEVRWHQTSRCIGPDCPYYHAPLLLYRGAWGRCGMERRQWAVWLAVLAGAAAVAGAVVLRGVM